MTWDFLAETERFELSVPVRELHLSRVKSALRRQRGEVTIPPRIHADLRPHQVIPGLGWVALDALYALQNRPKSGHSGCSGTLGGPLARAMPRAVQPFSLVLPTQTGGVGLAAANRLGA